MGAIAAWNTRPSPALSEQIIALLQREQDRLDAESGDYLMDTADCINVIRENAAALRASQPDRDGYRRGLDDAAKVADEERASAREAHHEATEASERAYRRGRGEAATAIAALIRSGGNA